ncbi:MAG: thrombospondin type 3 repeat-containing protein [Chitinophagaceae bacterium]|nr:thrombospondin type 3 repeat-containing protein [Chitinophagaceae bacterium]
MKSLKLLSLTIAILLFATQAFSQTTAKPAKTKYTVSAGLLGALNYTKFRMKDAPSVDYKSGVGYAIGGWANFPLFGNVSFEPQAQLSWLKYSLNSNTSPLSQFDGTMQYQSYPFLFKVQTGKNFALLVGPQFDFLNTLKNSSSNGVFYKRMFIAQSTAVTAGFEFFPHSTIQLYGRYIYGLSDMKDGINPNKNTLGFKYYNNGAQLGIKVKLFGKKIVPPVVPVVVAPVDTDGDGIVDSLDKCPTVPGVAKYNGCPIPDTDKDGINDEQDKCPTVPGLAKYNGCPIPDTDGDGINDEQDKCPTVPGLAKYNGCPIPDTDGDGINDEQDKCPTVPGVAAYQGCPDLTPVLNEAAVSFYFVINSAKLLDAKIAKAKFDPVLDLLSKYPKLHLDIQGNTDNTGNDKINDPLSQRRADAVQKAFLNKGIAADRLTTKANGSKKPVADNKTKAGRKLNRNVTLVPSFVD